MSEKDKPLDPDAALAAIRDCVDRGAVQFAEGSKVYRFPEVLSRFMLMVTGSNDGFSVSDESHLTDFGLDESDLEALEQAFGVRLPSTDFYLWEALFVLAGQARGAA